MDFASENQDASGIQAAKLGSRPGTDAQSVAKRYVYTTNFSREPTLAALACTALLTLSFPTVFRRS